MEFCNFSCTNNLCIQNYMKYLSLQIVLAQLTKEQEINDLRLPQHVSICRSTISLIALNKKINKCIF